MSCGFPRRGSPWTRSGAARARMTAWSIRVRGSPLPPRDLVDVAKLVTAYYTVHPDPGEAAQRVSFGTSGHRGSAFTATFNEDHILATTQAICEYRAAHGIDGPLFLGADTHALSETGPGQRAGGAGRQRGPGADRRARRLHADARPCPGPSWPTTRAGTGPRADGIVVTPSHNPPPDGGFKYNPPDGGPAGTDITSQIQDRANELLADGLTGVRRVPYARAVAADTTGTLRLPRPLRVGPAARWSTWPRSGRPGSASAPTRSAGRAWPTGARSASVYGLDLTVVNPEVDPTFRFMTLDWDGKIRMDCSSPYAMASLIGRQHEFTIATGNDTDADRHGIVTPDGGLMNPNHYLAVAIDYLYRHRPDWPEAAAVGQDAGQLVDDRPGRRGPGPHAARGAGRVQVVRARTARRVGGVRRRGERRRVVPAARRVGVDDGQGRDHPGPAGLGDHRRDRRTPRPSGTRT